ncbi:hydroxymethylpyrimidine/phosphomethylpyrimidine kinase [Saprolegnia diclina VS20]|uniref:Hydroxymethylpyrimidine/phosphomethylpyrimidine kinase n=1 Tax=Saprolegnia diclina (strain VS20) TaxID=1156394 RepID=T0QK97_SAPDV|nr:hydroxymethylpyrimidine/phosphomethylpyrimidine kinase [Saprolegnia diclina VS20]EQC38429.1 hydroxymethylpyrimidine/phosphomethylpyrimidine kinase [Saprolegnia diclina VS20]|eukprot:XP_008608021.1 hydroxymethylpyrimidine/phosphomethylpyrimidine kinase [Saprolegnia diclina VS20]
MRFNQFTLPATDLPASIAFYSRLGCSPIVVTETYARFEDGAGGSTFSLEKVDQEVPKMPGHHAMTMYFEVDDVDATVAALSAQGVVFDELPEDKSWLWRESRLRDPAGNRVCLYYAGNQRRFPPWRVDGRTAP